MREAHRLHRGVGELGEINMQAAERESRSRAGLAAGRLESLQQAAVVQQVQDLPAETAGLRDVPDLRPPLQDQRSHAGQTQLSGQHQADRAGAHDDHVGFRHTHFPTPISAGCGFGQRFCGTTPVLPQAPRCAIC